MKAFLTPLQGLAEFEQIKEKSKTNKGILQVSGCMESQKSHLMYGLSGIAPYRLILAEDERRAREIYEDYRFYDRKVYSYPAKDLLFFQADIHGNLLIRQRMKVIKALLEEKELTVVTSIDGCMDFLESLEKIKEQLIHYESDSTVDIEQLKNQLVALGYERVGQVEMPGQFSVRGGIVDIYCLTEENPWRIELWGDEIDTIRCFEPQSQRSMDQIECVSVFPAAEVIADDTARRRAVGMIQNELESQLAVFKKVKEPDKAKRLREETNRILEALGEDVVLEAPDSYISYFYPRTVQLSEYFDEKNTLVFLDEPMRLKERGDGVQAEFEESMKNRLEQGFLLPGQTALLTPAKK